MNSDFKDLLRAFNVAGVRYLVVGGWAFMEYAEPRYTKDLDLWIDRTQDNPERVLRALREFGAPLRDLTVDDLMAPDTFYQIGLPPNRIDIITQLQDMSFTECWERRKTVQLGDLRVEYISISDLIANKERTGRPHDLDDAEKLRAAQLIKS
jgi:predicted nucleotidyltransferase